MNLNLCRDVVGNTICADFLDYLYRDWHHLGKPLYEDKRIYQYMEARQRNPEEGTQEALRDNCGEASLSFVINIGSREKIRHDALTSILQLLEARYELAETVLFHRAKLSITALLDRCLLEIGQLYEMVQFDRYQLQSNLENLLLDAPDDGLPDVLEALRTGGSDESIKVRIDDWKKSAKSSAKSAVSDGLFVGPQPVVALESLECSIRSMIENLRNRSIYKVPRQNSAADLVNH